MLAKKIVLSTCLVLFLSITSLAQAAWYDTNYKYKQKITIQNGQVTADLTDFPVLITQADLDTAFFDHVEKATLSNMDIIFTNAAENTKLSREIVQFNSGSQTLQAWVKTDLNNFSDTIIYMYYGYSGANEPNSTDTWSSSYAGVWHMESATGSANDVPDSTTNGNQGTSQSMTTSNIVTGQMGSALDFNGDDEYVNCGNDNSLNITGNLTLSAWIKQDTTENLAMRIISKKEDSGDVDGYGWTRNRPYDGMYFYGVYDANYALSADVALDTNWHYAVAVVSGTSVAFYIDGTAVTMSDSTITALVAGTHDLFIANQDTGNTKCFDGSIDEARVASTNRSSTWISTSYNNQSNPGNFYNVGSEISVVSDRYRSIGASSTSALASGGGNALTISGTTATFASSDLADNIGVGDALQYDSNDGDTAIDEIVFIHARIDARNFTVRKANGAVPEAATGTNIWNIFRAYRSLNDAESGTENASIDDAVENFDSGNRDLVTNEEIMHYACYGNGTTADNSAVTWNGWTTSADYYIHIYTPYLTTEVGTSQRHSGVWNTSAYHLEVSNSAALTLSDSYIRLEGLQIHTASTNANVQPAIYITGTTGTGGTFHISQCMIRGYSSGNNDNNNGIYIASAGTGIVYIWNNIIYDFVDANNGHGIRLDDNGFTVYAYNNTVYNCSLGLRTGGNTFIAKNNIVQAASSNAYRDAFDLSSDYNISNDGDAPGTNVKINTTVQFANTGSGDFHLDDNDTAAKNWGADLSADAGLPISVDIDNEARTVTWCSGADENDVLPGSPTFTPTVTVTPTPTYSTTYTPTVTDTPTLTATLTATESATATHSPTASPTSTVTGTSTASPTISQTSTVTLTSTPSPVHTPTETSTVSPTPTISATYTVSPTLTHSATYTRTVTITITSTISPTPSITTTSTETPEYIVPNDLEKVVVYPNPYRLDQNPRREVNFYNMPEQAKIRIYDITGKLIANLSKDSAVPWIQWEMKNQQGSEIASGIYVYIITSNGQERRGKIAILK